jgi:hypothetical protein
MAFSILAELRIYLIKHLPAIPKRPQFADRFITHPHRDAANLL